MIRRAVCWVSDSLSNSPYVIEGELPRTIIDIVQWDDSVKSHCNYVNRLFSEWRKSRGEDPQFSIDMSIVPNDYLLGP